MNRKYISLITLVVILVFGACNNHEEKEAMSLFASSSELFEEGSYDDALLMLDSLNKSFPKEIEARKEALNLMRKIKLAKSQQDSLSFVSEMQTLVQFSDSLYKDFVLVEAPKMPDENVIRYKGYNPSLNAPQANFLDCYIASDGTLELVAGTSSNHLQGVTYIIVKNSKEDSYIASDTLAYDGGMNYRYTDYGQHYERLIFTDAKALRIASFIASSENNNKLEVSFGLDNGRMGKPFELAPKAKQAITESYRYAKALADLKELQKGLDNHEKRLLLESKRKRKEALQL